MWWEKGATSDSTECSPEGIDEQGWFGRMGRSQYVFQSTTQPIDPLLQQHSLPFPLTNFPLWFLYCTKLRYKYLLSLGTDSSSQEEQSTSPHSLARPGQCVSASSPPAELLCLATQPRGSLHQLAPAGGRDSDGPFHLPDPIHSSVWGYPDRQQAGSLLSQSSVKAASDQFYCTWTMLPLFSSQPPALL